MINQFYHAGTAATVQFPFNPLRGPGETARRFQSSGYDGDGNAYVYSKNLTKRRERTLIFNGCTLAVLDAAVMFVQSRGDKIPFTWYDHAGASHTIRFLSARLDYKEITPGRYRLEFKISEDLP